MSVNTPLSHERLVVRTWHPCHASRTALPPTTIYCEPGAFVGYRVINRLMPQRGVNRLMPHPVLSQTTISYIL